MKKSKQKLVVKPEKSYAVYLGKHKLEGGYKTKRLAEFEKAHYSESKINKLLLKLRSKYV